MLLQVLQPPLNHLGLQAVRDGQQVEVDEPLQRVLVHRVDVGQVGEAEEERGRVGGHWFVLEARRIDLLRRLQADQLLAVDVVRDYLRLVECLNG